MAVFGEVADDGKTTLTIIAWEDVCQVVLRDASDVPETLWG